MKVHRGKASCWLLAVSTSIGGILPTICLASDIERVPVGSLNIGEMVFEQPQDGAWRTKSQLVWDSRLQKLNRRLIRIWDPLAQRSLDISWVSKDGISDQDGAVSGEGQIVWRTQGSISYETDAIVAEYRGQMRNGMANGIGEFIEASGAFYRGEWQGGVMHGRGRLHLANGDEYVGTFKKGRRDGIGKYIDSAGQIYEGGFTLGSREGSGVMRLPEGVTYTAIWKNGTEINGSRKTLPTKHWQRAELASFSDYPDVQLGVSVDRRPVKDQNAWASVMSYTSESSEAGLKVFPDDERLLEAWRGHGDIGLTDDEQDSVQGNRSFLGPPDKYKPVPLVFDIRNKSPRPLRVTGVFLNVEKSKSDREPALQAVGPNWGGCGGPGFDTKVKLENYGWAKVKNIKLKGSFVKADGSPVNGSFDKSPGAFETSLDLDNEADVRSSGADVTRLRETQFYCGKGVSDDKCLDEAKRAGIFGKLNEAVGIRGANFVLPYHAEISYDWEDTNGQSHSKKSLFNLALGFGSRDTEAECGEGGTAEARFKKPFMLRTDAENYKIAVPLSDDVPAGVTARWRIQLDAEMSSTHKLRIVAQLADGRDVASRPLEVLYFKPKPFPDLYSEVPD